MSSVPSALGNRPGCLQVADDREPCSGVSGATLGVFLRCIDCAGGFRHRHLHASTPNANVGYTAYVRIVPAIDWKGVADRFFATLLAAVLPGATYYQDPGGDASGRVSRHNLGPPMSLFEAFNLGKVFASTSHRGRPRRPRFERGLSRSARSLVARNWVLSRFLDRAKPTPTMRTAFTARCEPNEPSHPVGCARLRLGPRDPFAPLPFEKPVRPRWTAPSSTLEAPARDDCGGFRLAVRSHFRRRKGERQTPVAIQDEDFGSTEQPRFPYIPIGLYLGAVAMAAARHRDALCADQNRGYSRISQNSG